MRTLHAAAALIALAIAASPLAAQRYELEEWETPMQGWGEVTLWNTDVVKSDQSYDHFGQSAREQGLSTYTAELEYGVTDRVTVGAYADFDRASGIGLRYAQTRLNLRYRFFNKYQYFFDPALYVEYYAPRGKYDPNNRVEMRVILEHDFNDFRWDINPELSRSFSSDSTAKVQAAISTGIYYRRAYALQPGIELYSEFGTLGSSPGAREQKHIVFPSVNIRFRNAFTWNIGVGFGLTPMSDKTTFKTMLTYEFQTVRPSDQAQ